MTSPTLPEAETTRVLHVDAAREWRGGQNQVRLLVSELAAREGVEQTLAVGAGSRLAREGREAGVEVRELPWSAAADPRAVAGLAGAVRGYDVVHAHSAHALQASVLALALSGPPAGLVAARRSANPVSPATAWRRADLVLAVSEAVRGVLLRSGLRPGRVRVVPSGVDPEGRGPALPGRLREAAGAGDDGLLVGAVGSLDPGKDHRTLIRAAARVARERPAVRFVVAGEGPLREELEAEVRELGLGERLALPGRVPDVARSLGDLDLFVMPSREEGLGTAALEAMAAGVPAVLARAGGLTDVAGDVVPTVPPEDPEALAAEILRLLDDPEVRRELGRAGRRRVEQRFSAARTAGATLEAYRAVAGSRRLRREHQRQMERDGRLRRARPPGSAGAS